MVQDTLREVTTSTVPHRVLGKTGERLRRNGDRITAQWSSVRNG